MRLDKQFVDAIRAKPADASLYLIYADYLAEIGDEDAERWYTYGKIMEKGPRFMSAIPIYQKWVNVPIENTAYTWHFVMYHDSITVKRELQTSRADEGITALHVCRKGVEFGAWIEV